MNKKYFLKRLWIAVVFGLAVFLQSTNAFARDMGRSRPREMINVGRQRYTYHDGRFFKPSWLWFEISLFHPLIGAVVTYLPSGYGAVVIGGSRYYRYDNIYYRDCPGGYVVVPDPQVIQNVIPAQNLSGEKVSINILNSNGSYTTVVLVKQNGGYLGPQGEFYPGNPTVEQLKSLYGK